MFDERPYGEDESPPFTATPESTEPQDHTDRSVNAELLAGWRTAQQGELALITSLRAWERSGAWSVDGARTGTSWLEH